MVIRLPNREGLIQSFHHWDRKLNVQKVFWRVDGEDYFFWISWI